MPLLAAQAPVLPYRPPLRAGTRSQGLRRWIWPQRAFWSTRRLDAARAQDVLRAVDASARVERLLASDSHQVFEIVFAGRPCVAKFAGQPYACKASLRDAMQRLIQLEDAGLPVPTVLYDATERLRHPFFVMPYVGTVECDDDGGAEHERSRWAMEARLARGYAGSARRAGLTLLSLDRSVAELHREIESVAGDLAGLDLWRAPYSDAVRTVEARLFAHPWIAGATTPPKVIHDGQRFWTLDWQPPRYVPPLKWIADYLVAANASDPARVRAHASYLALRLGFEPRDEEFRRELDAWHRYVATSAGLQRLRATGDADLLHLANRLLFAEERRYAA